MKRILFLCCLVMLAGLVGCSGPLSNIIPTSSAGNPGGGFSSSGSFPLVRPATGRKTFVFDPRQRAWAVYDRQGKRVKTGRASGGSAFCSDLGRSCRTVVGRFSIISKGNSNCVSGRFPLETNGGAPMPYCMHFGSRGYAVHGSYHVPDYNASHGCIRVTPTVARWLNNQFLDIGSTVIVKSY